MLGAIVGDIVGSVYERYNIKTKRFQMFCDSCFFTDDTVMTVATAEALMNGGKRDDFIDAYKKWGRLYPNAGYGGRFDAWLRSDDRKPYNSWGNGSAMRVSPCGWIADCGSLARTGMCSPVVREAARLSAEATHNHPEGVKGALAVADAVFICRVFSEEREGKYPGILFPVAGDCKRKVKEHISREYGYDLTRTLDEIRPSYRFEASCQETVPQAITAFLESQDFEDAIRCAISLGGDSDTIAAITGSIAEAAYGVPDRIWEKARSYLDRPLLDVCCRWEIFMKQRRRLLKKRR